MTVKGIHRRAAGTRRHIIKLVQRLSVVVGAQRLTLEVVASSIEHLGVRITADLARNALKRIVHSLDAVRIRNALRTRPRRFGSGPRSRCCSGILSGFGVASGDTALI